MVGSISPVYHLYLMRMCGSSTILTLTLSKCHSMSELRSRNARKYQQKNNSCHITALYIHLYGSISALQRKKNSRSLFLSFHSSYLHFCHSFPVKLQLTFSPSSSFQSSPLFYSFLYLYFSNPSSLSQKQLVHSLISH